MPKPWPPLLGLQVPDIPLRQQLADLEREVYRTCSAETYRATLARRRAELTEDITILTIGPNCDRFGVCSTYALGRVLGVLDVMPQELSTWSLNLFLWSRCAQVMSPAPGDLAVYFDAKSWQHVGVVASTEPVRIDSKFGITPAIYRHSMTAVLPAYGNRLCFFRLL